MRAYLTKFWWTGMDLNHRRAALQAAALPLSYRSILPVKPGRYSKSGGRRDESNALPLRNRATTGRQTLWPYLHLPNSDQCDGGPGRTRTYEAYAARLQSLPFAARDTNPFSHQPFNSPSFPAPAGGDPLRWPSPRLPRRHHRLLPVSERREYRHSPQTHPRRSRRGRASPSR